MMTVLQQLLESELVEIDDDQQMEKLQAAAVLLQKQLTDGSLNLARATLVAMDPHIAAEDPVLDTVYPVVAGQWSTIKKRYPDRPVALLRGVLAQALAGAAEADAVAAVIWPTANSYAPYAPLAREQEVWNGILMPIADRAERAAAVLWSGTGDATAILLPSPEIPPISVTAETVDSATLQAHLAAAAGPVKGPQGVPANNNTMNTGSYAGSAHPDWVNAFAKTTAAGIALVVNAALKATADSIDVAPLSSALADHTSQITKAIGKALAPLHAIDLRSRTLFWRQALYSLSQRQPYRNLAPELAVIAIAADLAGDVPPMSPGSVDHLVWEAADAVLGDTTTTVRDFGGAIIGGSTAATSALLGEGTELTGRTTLASFLRFVATAGKVPSDVRGHLGLAVDAEVRLSDLARWLFRDLRAERIAADLTPRPRGRRK